MKNISILICVAVVAILAVGCTGKGEKDLSANLVPSVSESPKNAAKVITFPTAAPKAVEQVASQPKEEKEILRLQEGQEAKQALRVKAQYFTGLSGEQLVEISVENFGRWQSEDILLAKVRYWYEGESQTVTNDSISIGNTPYYWQPTRTRNGNKLLHFNLEVYSAFDENLEDLPLLDDAGNKTEMITLGTFDVNMP